MDQKQQTKFKSKHKKMFQIVMQKYNNDGTLKHICKDGTRYHVLYWNTQGRHCLEPKCEINRK